MATAKNDEPTTTLDDDTTKPSVTEPGDGPADTTDPTEVAHSVTPQPGPEALATGTVNAVTKGTRPSSKKKTTKDRVEEYEQVAPNGDVVKIKRNIDTGETEIVS